MRQRLGLVLLLLVALAVVWWFVHQEEDQDPAPTAPVERTESDGRDVDASLPQLAGAKPAGGSPRAAVHEGSEVETVEKPRSLHGIVVDEQGEAVAGATVFLLPPADVTRSADESRPQVHTTANAEGEWTLGPIPPSVRWVGVLAKGFLPLHHQIDVAPAEAPLRLVLAAGAQLLLRVQSVDGGPLEHDTDISVEPTAKDARPWPGPGESWRFEDQVTIPAGSQSASIRLGTTSEVEVSARYGHMWWTVDPDDPVVVPKGQTLTFTVARSCKLDFHVFDAASGEPLPRGFSYTILTDGALLFGGQTIRPGGRLRLNLGLRPGRYVLRVWATGYRVRESEVVTLTSPGEEATVEVRLERDPTRGNLRISLPILPQLPRRETMGGETQTAPAFFLWMRPAALADRWARDFATTESWGSLDGEVRRESDTDYLFEGVPEGEVALLVGETASGHVALEKGIRIRGGRTDTTLIDLEKGIRFDPNELIPVGGTCRSFHIRHPAHGELPTWSFREGAAYWLKPGEVPPLEFVIGPYPGPEIEVEVVLADGNKKTKTIR